MKIHEILSEGGWASTLTQGTHIGPQLVANVMKSLVTDFIPRLNKFLETKQLPPTEISAPGGSATYYERDLRQNPNKEYGDVDVQFHVARLPGMSNSAIDSTYGAAIKEFCDQDANYSTDNGKNVILQIGKEYVQVDLVMSYYENKAWIKALAPEWNVKGVLCNSVYGATGLALSLSMGGGHGIQAKTVNGKLVPFNLKKDTVLATVTNDPKNWAVDIAKYLGCTKMSPLLSQYPGLLDETRVADTIMSVKGIAQTLELNGKIPSAIELLTSIQQHYIAKIDAVINSSKFDKAASPEAIKKAADTKSMLSSKSQEFARLFTT